MHNFELYNKAPNFIFSFDVQCSLKIYVIKSIVLSSHIHIEIYKQHFKTKKWHLWQDCFADTTKTQNKSIIYKTGKTWCISRWNWRHKFFLSFIETELDKNHDELKNTNFKKHPLKPEAAGITKICDIKRQKALDREVTPRPTSLFGFDTASSNKKQK